MGRTVLKRFLYALVFFPMAANNTTARAKSADSLDSKDQLSTIIVTAQKRVQDQQKVPIAVTTLPGDFLIRHSIDSIEDLASTVPGFVTTHSVNYGAAPLAIRGVGGANGGGNFFADEPVAVYIDEVYVGRLSISTAALFDIEDIEVLRGPQGTLYGRNSTAGAVLIKSKVPSEELTGYIGGEVASYDEYRINGALSGTIADDLLSGRIAAGYSDRRGYGVNSFDGSAIGGAEDFFVRASLRFTPDDNLTIDLIGDYFDQKSNTATIAVADLSNPASASPFTVRPDFDQVLDDRTFAINDPNFYDAKHRGINLKATWNIGTLTLNSVSAFRSYEFDAAQDSDGTALSLINNDGNGQNEQFSQEIRLSSDDQGPFSWIVGGMYFHEDNDFFFQIRNINGFFGLGTLAAFRATQKVNALAAFAEAKWAINPIFSITAGGRYSSEKKNFTNQLAVNILNGGMIPASAPVFPGQSFAAGATLTPPTDFADSGRFSDFSPRVVLEAKPTDDLLIYASYSQGFTSGGFNVFGLAPEFGSQGIHSYEVGLKSQFWNDRIRFNASAFHYDYSNLQVRLPVPTGGVNIANAAEARIQGAELELTIMPVAALNISANISLLDAEFTQGTIPAVPENINFPFGAPIPLSPVDIAGNSLSRAPDFQFYGAADYTIALGDIGQFDLHASYRHQSKVFFLETNQTQSTFAGEAFNEVNIRVSYTHLPTNLTVAFFGKNIFDDRHASQVTALGAFPNAALNEPVKWGVEFLKKF